MSAEQNTMSLKDFEVNIKIKLAFLWVSVTLCYLYGDYFELYVPRKTAGLISGDNLLNSPLKLLSAAVLLAIPAVMVFLSIILKPKLNKLLNISFGLFFTAIMLLIALTSLTPWKSFYVFLAVVESIITGLIVLYAWKWPKNFSEKKMN
ncbi:DUF6326 family protein [Flavobacterium sp.]|uniref:DUF6326 family protein n=1 Tax=Flavobacterium sp. TaxID=239 RepID=UPI003D130828